MLCTLGVCIAEQPTRQSSAAAAAPQMTVLRLIVLVPLEVLAVITGRALKAEHVSAARLVEAAIEVELAVECGAFELADYPVLAVHHLQPAVWFDMSPESSIADGV